MSDPTAQDLCNACASEQAPTPEAIVNRPGLDSIRYRIGDYGSFRQAMLQAIHAQAALKSWTARADDDFGIALLDMWAYVLDILTFYQERIANEAYLSTAVLPESLRRLVGQIDYHPAPGKAAATYLAFALQQPSPSLPDLTIPANLRVQSVPGPNQAPQKFETGEPRYARFAWNLLSPVKTKQPALAGATSLYLDGRQTTVKRGDMLLVVADGPASPWDLRPLTDVTLLPSQTKLSWQQGLSAAYPSPAIGAVTPSILRRRASLFGFNAPPPQRSYTVTSTYTYDANSQVTGVATVITPGAAPADYAFARPDGSQPVIYLDAEYPSLTPGDWLALVLPTASLLFTVSAVATVAYGAYNLSGKVTKVTLDHDETSLDSYYAGGNARQTVVLFGAEPFELGPEPLTTPLAGQVLPVVGKHTDLEKGRPLLVCGNESSSGDPVGEAAFLASPPVVGDDTELTLTQPLANSYALDTVRIFANVAYATHGETTHEVLGSGDASQPFQSFVLKKAPLTFVPQAGAPNGAASTLTLRANGVQWDPAASLYGAGPADAFYTTRIEDGKAVVRGGDGATGQRFPTGRGNLTADYRVGIGEAGNLAAGVLTTLVDRPPGVKSVINPLAAEGGVDPEPQEAVRTNAPATVRTFGRIVSLRDFEDSARQYAGIAKARAEQVWNGEESLVSLTVARIHGDPMEPGGALYQALRDDLDSRRDPNRALELQDYTPRPVIVRATLYIDAPRYVPDAVLAAARGAVLALFDFDALALGQTVYLGQVEAALQRVEGVMAVDVDSFYFRCPPSLATPAERSQFYQDRQSLGAPTNLGSDGLPVDGSDVQPYAGALSGELITIQSPETDLTLTPISGIRGAQL